ncbi:MAG: hypothetical protein J6Z15_00540, partial [Oscillospiraceae bacterium]|nr:hypothetical protein [Oscillospiraceae bacterium]
MQNSKRKNQNKKRQRNMLLLPLLLVLLVTAAAIVLLNARLHAANDNTPLQPAVEGNYEEEIPTKEDIAEDIEAPEPTPTPTPEPVYVHTIPENLLTGMEPDPDGYHESMDAEELTAFLQHEEVQKFIGGRQLVWNAEIERFPDTPVRWYFDGTILCIVWQEVEAQAVGTFSETMIADGSQLRRKISADELWSFAF